MTDQIDKPGDFGGKRESMSKGEKRLSITKTQRAGGRDGYNDEVNGEVGPQFFVTIIMFLSD